MAPVVHGAMGAAAKKALNWCDSATAPVWVPSQRSLAPSVTSVTSVPNDKGDNEMIPGLCIDLLAFALRKTSARRPSDERAV